jgi:RNA polymerase sigma-70 factor (ECF subfamily)
MDETEFTALIRRHGALIHKIAFAYCREPADRDDLVQDIAAQLWRSRERYDPRFAHTTWIYRIALNVAISFYRRERRHRDQRAAIDDHPIAVAPIEPAPELARLLRGIAALGPLDRALVVLYLEGSDHAAIAEVLGISISNVGTKLGRIKARLRDALDAPARADAPVSVDRSGKESHGPR